MGSCFNAIKVSKDGGAWSPLNLPARLKPGELSALSIHRCLRGVTVTRGTFSRGYAARAVSMGRFRDYKQSVR